MKRHTALALLASLLPACAPERPPERAGMVHVAAGEFPMGSRDDDAKVYAWEKAREQPQHPVFVSGFLIDRHEVTNAEYERFDPTHRRDAGFSPCDDCPVNQVSWEQAARYCASQQPPKRLPREAEWEKAAKGGRDGEPEPLADHAWFAENSIRRAQPVMQKEPNGYALYDMLGNVREWTADWYAPDYYAARVRDDPAGPRDGRRKVERGGAFFLPARGVTTTIRYNHPPDSTLYFLGFRCAADAR